MNLVNTSCLVTGAASGIGAALLAGLLRYPGTRVLAADRDGERLASTVAHVCAQTRAEPARVTPFVGDLSQQAGVDAMLDAAFTRLGRLDCAFANAGFAYYEAFNGAWEHVDALFRLNVYSPIYLLHTLRQRQPEHRATLVITASAMAHVGSPGYAVYAASKAALHRFAETYAFERPPHDPLRVMLVYPVSTRTGFFHASTDGPPAPVPWPSQTPQQVAAAMLRGVERDARAVYPSRLFRAVLTINRVLPFMFAGYIRREQQALRRWLAQRSATPRL
jgi:NAD(P)-dependent dehydrogenase (short-subunit alcohol dehydrogenase family)